MLHFIVFIVCYMYLYYIYKIYHLFSLKSWFFMKMTCYRETCKDFDMDIELELIQVAPLSIPRVSVEWSGGQTFNLFISPEPEDNLKMMF